MKLPCGRRRHPSPPTKLVAHMPDVMLSARRAARLHGPALRSGGGWCCHLAQGDGELIYLSLHASTPIASAKVPRNDIHTQHTRDLLPGRPSRMRPIGTKRQQLLLAQATQGLVTRQRSADGVMHKAQRFGACALAAQGRAGQTTGWNDCHHGRTGGRARSAGSMKGNDET
ncbi:MAG: hypothetical protein JNL93_04175 [Pelomonas sp.]|nr:hypothetical protein [Roseateles sp.]